MSEVTNDINPETETVCTVRASNCYGETLYGTYDERGCFVPLSSSGIPNIEYYPYHHGGNYIQKPYNNYPPSAYGYHTGMLIDEVIQLLVRWVLTENKALSLFSVGYRKAVVRGDKFVAQQCLNVIDKSDKNVTPLVIVSACYLTSSTHHTSSFCQHYYPDEFVILFIQESVRRAAGFFVQENVTYTPVADKQYNPDQYLTKVSDDTVWVTTFSGLMPQYYDHTFTLLVALTLFNKESRYRKNPLSWIGIYDVLSDTAFTYYIKDIDPEIYNAFKDTLLS